jgi:septal ring factor EnvC (AmiA/AmiB activator)
VPTNARALEQQRQYQEHELAELRQRLLAQQPRLGELQAQEQVQSQDNGHLEALTQSSSAHEHVALQLTELTQTHQALDQRHGHGTQSLAEAQMNLAVIERERSPLVERLNPHT